MPKLRTLFAAAVVFTAVPAFAETAKPIEPPQSDPAPTSQNNQTRPRVDVAFVLDTTGSMGGLLDGAKQKIWSIASQIARGKPTPILRVAVVAYRDKGDNYVVKKFDLTRDLDGVYGHLKTLDASGGGDTPEHVGRGLGEAVKNLEWSKEANTMKMIFVVGDAPPQNYQDGWDVGTWSKKAAQQGIVVNTIRCGGDGETEQAFRKISKLASGSFASIDGSGGMVAVSTPYDSKLAELNSAIATKGAWGGDGEARARAEKKAGDAARMDVHAAADKMSYASTTEGGGLGRAYAPAAPTGAVDLVTAKPETVAKLPAASLPEQMKAMSADERVGYVKKLAKERRVLEEEAAKVATQRDDWMKNNVKQKEDSFDNEVLKQVREQGAKHGIAY